MPAIDKHCLMFDTNLRSEILRNLASEISELFHVISQKIQHISQNFILPSLKYLVNILDCTSGETKFLPRTKINF